MASFCPQQCSGQGTILLEARPARSPEFNRSGRVALASQCLITASSVDEVLTYTNQSVSQAPYFANSSVRECISQLKTLTNLHWRKRARATAKLLRLDPEPLQDREPKVA